jgi:hypothetical protein
MDCVLCHSRVGTLMSLKPGNLRAGLLAPLRAQMLAPDMHESLWARRLVELRDGRFGRVRARRATCLRRETR